MIFHHSKSGLIQKLKLSKAFTLLEIIVVIIIVGVLASLALPLVFSSIERSRSAEALNAISILRRAFDNCHMQAAVVVGEWNTAPECDTFEKIVMEDPGNAPGSHFTYDLTAGSGITTITATRNALDGGDGVSTIRFIYNPMTQEVTSRSGTSIFSGIK